MGAVTSGSHQDSCGGGYTLQQYCSKPLLSKISGLATGHALATLWFWTSMDWGGIWLLWTYVAVLCTIYIPLYRNVILAQACSIPGYAAKMAEGQKFYNDKKSFHPVSSKYGGGHVFVPFVMEDGGAHWVLMPWLS